MSGYNIPFMIERKKQLTQMIDTLNKEIQHTINMKEDAELRRNQCLNECNGLMLILSEHTREQIESISD